jgi:hypothetical protein
MKPTLRKGRHDSPSTWSTTKRRPALIVMTFGLMTSCAGYSQLPTEATIADDAPLTSGEAAASSAFCLFEVPSVSGGARRLINLGIVQYVELADGELRIAYGGGNLGSGYETKIALKSKEQGLDLLARMRKTARACK